jgi:hypothetical protein
MSNTENPIKRLPKPSRIHAYIGRLNRELRLARRLLRLAKAVSQERQTNTEPDSREANPCQVG